MKSVIIMLLIIVSTKIFANDCERVLLNGLNADPNIENVQLQESYDCGINACAIIYKQGEMPYENTLFAFLEATKNLNVNWATIDPDTKIAHGHQKVDGRKFTYVSAFNVGDEDLSIVL